jgi:hypothetical protein
MVSSTKNAFEPVTLLARQTVGPQVIDMFSRSIFLMVVAAKLVIGRDDSSSVREQEDALAKALNAKNKIGLLTLTDNLFHVSWECGSAVRNFSTNVLRQDWIDDVSQLRIDSYKANISEVRFVRALRLDKDTQSNKSIADLTVSEFWTIQFASG